jgi:hypothetical protein
VNSLLQQAQSAFFQQTDDHAGSQQMAVQAVEKLVPQQAVALPYFDVFWMVSGLAGALVFQVLLMKRSVAEKRASPGRGRR